MNKPNRAYQTNPNAPTRSTKDVEIEILLETTRRLKKANEMRSFNFPAFATALRDNCQLWLTFAVDVANSKNGLPQELRAKLFFLCEFTQEHTRNILSGNLSASVLVEINLSVLRGLANNRSVG